MRRETVEYQEKLRHENEMRRVAAEVKAKYVKSFLCFCSKSVFNASHFCLKTFLSCIYYYVLQICL